MMLELVSEPVVPLSGSGDTAAMGRGEPGVPSGFVWREREYRVIDRVAAWKESSREGHTRMGELYLRRHYYRLRMDDGTAWTVYFLRQTPKSGPPKARWFLYSIGRADGP